MATVVIKNTTKKNKNPSSEFELPSFEQLMSEFEEDMENLKKEVTIAAKELLKDRIKEEKIKKLKKTDPITYTME